MKSLNKRMGITLGIVALLALAGCGGGSGGGSAAASNTTTTTPPSAVATVSLITTQ